jgi:hypothetical protein
MRCSYQHASSGDRCVFTSIMLLGALFALAAPVARVPLVVSLVLFGVPLMTFAVAAPSRLGLFKEVRLAFRGLEATVLQSVLLFAGRRQLAFKVRDNFRHRVETTYASSSPRLAEAVMEDPLRLHHARRLASFGTLLAMLAGLGLPFIFPNTYTFGDGIEAPAVFAFDLLTFGIVGRVVTERTMIRLFEVTHALRDGADFLPRLRATPLTMLLGAALGAVGALVVVSAGAMACALETALIDAGNLQIAALWFIRETAPHGLPLGIMIGVVLGTGMGLAQSRMLPKQPSLSEDD